MLDNIKTQRIKGTVKEITKEVGCQKRHKFSDVQKLLLFILRVTSDVQRRKRYNVNNNEKYINFSLI